MPRRISDYVAIALISAIDWSDEPDVFSTYRRTTETFSGDLEKLKDFAEERTGLKLDENTIGEAVRALADCGMLQIIDDDFSGRYLKIWNDRLGPFMDKARSELTDAEAEGSDASAVLLRPSDFPNASALFDHEIFEDYHELGDEWLKRALQGIRQRQQQAGDLNSAVDDEISLMTIPASDRYVTLNHNQQSSLESASTEVITALERENSVDGDGSIRAWMLGQLKAGRELIRATTLNAYLLHQTVMQVLASLIEKFKDHAIGAAAKTLVELLIKHIFGIK